MSDPLRPCFARNGDSNSAKLNARIDVPVSDELDSAIQALATLAGVPKAEYARSVLEVHVFGRLHEVRRKVGQGGESGNG